MLKIGRKQTALCVITLTDEIHNGCTSSLSCHTQHHLGTYKSDQPVPTPTGGSAAHACSRFFPILTHRGSKQPLHSRVSLRTLCFHSTHPASIPVITTAPLTDRENQNFWVSFSASRWNNLSNMPITDPYISSTPLYTTKRS